MVFQYALKHDLSQFSAELFHQHFTVMMEKTIFNDFLFDSTKTIILWYNKCKILYHISINDFK